MSFIASSSKEVATFIARCRLPLGDEKKMQRVLHEALLAHGFVAEREVILGDGDIIDFMVGSVGIECKLQGQKREIYRQVERYAGHPEVAELVLASRAAIGMPALINGKPITVVNLSRAWL